MAAARFRVPHTLVLLFSMIVLAQILTYLLPQGHFERKQVAADGGHDLLLIDSAGTYQAPDGAELAVVKSGTYVHVGQGKGDGTLLTLPVEGLYQLAGKAASVHCYQAGSYQRVENLATKTVVAPGTYQQAEEMERLPWYAAFLLVPEGFRHGADIIIFIFIVGGAFGVLRATGATDALIGLALEKFGRRPAWLVAGGVILFALGSSSIGMAEEYLPFVPLLLSLCFALGFDAVTAIGILCIGYSVGYGVAIFNPFTVIIAQNIAGLPEISGAWYRAVIAVPFVAMGVHHVWSYARRVKEDPSRSLVADIEPDPALKVTEFPRFRASHLIVLLMLVGGILFFIYGIKMWEWYLAEMGALFLGLTVLMALVGRISPDETAKKFCAGANELTTTALLVGFAYTIEVVLDHGQIIDTIIHGFSLPLQKLGAAAAAVGMLFVQSLCNFFVPSGSGQAYVTMPLMAPLSDLVGVPRQVAVLAYQMGDGFTNIMVPTNAVLVGILTMARIPYERWLRFVLPFMVKAWILGSLVLVIAVWVGYE
jgi:uncharacterized ion transporter superfamily protein YfcC